MNPEFATMLLILMAGILFTFPLLPALIELHFKRDAQPLNVIQQYAGEIRHFSYGFRAYIADLLGPLQECVASGASAKGVMPDGDEYLLLGRADNASVATCGGKLQNCDFVVVVGPDVVLPDRVTFAKEIYAAGECTGGEESVFRALLGEKDIHLRRGSTVNRWAHAVGAFRAECGCNLCGRVSSDRIIRLESGCVFQRLNAPRIAFGGPNVESTDADVDTPHSPLPRSRRLVDEDLIIPAGETVGMNIVTRGRLHIGAGARVLGSVKSNQELVVEAGACVEGSLICASTVHIGRDCQIAGPVIAEHAMAVETGTRCGSVQSPTTVSAPTIGISEGAVVFGTLWARNEGQVVPRE
jgi:hypothetical protein